MGWGCLLESTSLGSCSLILIDFISCHKGLLHQVSFLSVMQLEDNSTPEPKENGEEGYHQNGLPLPIEEEGEVLSHSLEAEHRWESDRRTCWEWPTRSLIILKETSPVESSIQREVPMSAINCSPDWPASQWAYGFSQLFTLLSKAFV